nr:immunoglobulin heavy chain junction region [Macaca mulatta]
CARHAELTLMVEYFELW